MKRLIPVLVLAAGCSATSEPAREAPQAPQAEEAPAAAESTTSTPAGFTDNLDEALAAAKNDGKYVFACFSGSDWCGWCIRLEREVLSKRAFLDAVADDYHLVFIDSPHDETLLSVRARTENAKLIDKYRVEGFPTAIIFDNEGNEVTRTGYQRGGAARYARHLKHIREHGPELRREAELVRQHIDPIMDRIRQMGHAMAQEVAAFVEAEVAKGRNREEVLDEVDAPDSPFAQAFLGKLKAAAAEFEATEMPPEIKSLRDDALKMLHERIAAVEKEIEKARTPKK